jgi:putative mRNA 3-end processing factor
MLNNEPGFPIHVPPKEVDALVLTHCHLDHSGAVPIFHINTRKPVYGTSLTFDLASLLISDFIHLSSYYLPFEYLELETMMQSGVNLEFRKERVIGDFRVQLLDSGHLPGAAQALVEVNRKRLVYSSDYNATDTCLLRGADRNYGHLDALILETTYADEDHPDRISLEKEFIESVTEVVENGGTVLIPAFGVGRSQEIVCVLKSNHFQHAITIDGMARQASRIIMNHPSFLRDSQLFVNAMQTISWVEGWRDRRKTAKKPGVIISPAGMLKGGPAAFYIQTVGKKRQNAVFLVGYQIPGTPGRELLDAGKCVIDGKIRKINARVNRFDFSSHSGARELKETVKEVEGNPTIYTVHGAEGNCEMLSTWIKEEVGLTAVAPKTGEVFKV